MDFGYLKQLSEQVRNGGSINESFGDLDGSAIVGSEIDIINEAIKAMSDFVNEDYEAVSAFNESATMHLLAGNEEEFETLSEGRFDAIKERIKKFWEMVKSFFKKLVAKIKFTWDAYTKSGEALVDKYGDKVGTPGKVQIEGYKYADFDKWADNVETKGKAKITGLESEFNLDAIKSMIKLNVEKVSVEEIKKASTKTLAELEKTKSKISDAATFYGTTAGAMTGLSVKNGSLADIQSDILKQGRGGSTAKKTIKASEVGMVKIKELVKAERDHSSLNDMISALEDACDKAKTDMQSKLDRVVDNVGENVRADIKSILDETIKVYIKKAEMTVATGKAIVAVVISLFTERYKQARKLFIAVYNENNRVFKKKNEGFEGEDFEDIDFEELMEI